MTGYDFKKKYLPLISKIGTGLGIGLLVVSTRLSKQPVEFSTAWARISGAILFVFGWVYPHFLETSSILAYVYAAPTGLIPCPTLSVVIGMVLIFNGLGSRALSLTLGITGLFYGVIGIWRLGVEIDWFLVVGSALILLHNVLPNGSARMIGARPSDHPAAKGT